MSYSVFGATTQVASMGGHVAQFVADSLGSSGIVSGPAAGATITWMQAPQNGRYSVQLIYGYEPITGAGRSNNVRLQVDGTVVGSLTHLAGSSGTYTAIAILTVVATNWISLNVITGDTGNRYVGGLILSKLG